MSSASDTVMRKNDMGDMNPRTRKLVFRVLLMKHILRGKHRESSFAL